MNRRIGGSADRRNNNFARASLVMLALASADPPIRLSAAQQQNDVMKMVISPVAPGIHVISGFANGNILVADGGDEPPAQ